MPTRLLQTDDAPGLAALLRADRHVLATWTPRRAEGHDSDEGQAEYVRTVLEQHAAGTAVPLVILDHQGELVGAITLSSVIRGFFQSCSVGYWLGSSAQGRGLATGALRDAAEIAFTDLRLHRVQAETLLHNSRSQAVLERCGFTQYGVAEDYLEIAGRWQTNALFQLISPTPELVTTG